MIDEQVEKTAIQNETEVADNSVKESVESASKTYTQEEVDRLMQSERSKGKNELLKALDIKGIDDYKSKIDAYETKIKDYDNVKASNTQLANEVEKLNRDLVISRLNVDDKHVEDLITLATARAVNGKTFADAAKEVLENNMGWQKVSESVKLGTPKAEVDNSNKVSKELLERFPFLA